MYFYEVWVSGQSYHNVKPLTYGFDSALRVGSIVSVPLQRQKVVGFVNREVDKPLFPTKNIFSVIDDESLPKQLTQLLAWLLHYYPGPSGQVISLAVPSVLLTKPRQTGVNQTTQSVGQTEQPPLTDDQAQALKHIRSTRPKSVLLHGHTGTGKTRLYIELARDSLKEGRSVILLTPEIGLTPQLGTAFQKTFPGQVVVTHSDLTLAARRNNWLRILHADRPLVVIGPRSALFAPIKEVGLVVVDEFHEPTYKQEQTPRYLATRVGAKLAQLHGAQLILGSATPPVADYYAFQEKGLAIVRLTEPAVKGHVEGSVVTVVDLKERQAFNHSAWISDTLLAAIRKARQNGQQSLVFLNRRGTARAVLCRVCGWQALCPNCDLPLTYHGDTHTMLCHTCGHADKASSSCPECSADDISFKSVGTKALMAELERLVPGAAIQRFDSDTNKPDRLEHSYESVRKGRVDILVGTQMLGKGLDLPKLSVVGIITAETSLAFPDYTSEERTYQLISQALGRVNRGHIPGTAIVQTYHPASPLLMAAIARDYEGFYDQQIAERRLYGFPPFRFLLKLSCTRATSASAKKASMQLADKLRTSKQAVEVIGPNPAFAAKTHGKYHWQIIVKATKRQALLDIIRILPANWSYDIDPMNLL